MYKRLFRPLLFRMDPEKAHHLVFGGVRLLFRIPGMSKLISALYSVRNQKHEKRVMGLRFSNPVGLAAGFPRVLAAPAAWAYARLHPVPPE